MASYFGFEIVLGVGVNWLGQIGWGKLVGANLCVCPSLGDFGWISQVMGEHIGSPPTIRPNIKKGFWNVPKAFFDILPFNHSITQSLINYVSLDFQ